MWSLIKSISIKQCTYTQVITKTILLFFFIVYKNEWKQNKFWWQKNNNNKKVFNIDDIDVKKILVSTKEQYGRTKRIIIIHLNTLLGIIMMILLEHYV